MQFRAIRFSRDHISSSGEKHDAQLSLYIISIYLCLDGVVMALVTDEFRNDELSSLLRFRRALSLRPLDDFFLIEIEMNHYGDSLLQRR